MGALTVTDKTRSLLIADHYGLRTGHLVTLRPRPLFLYLEVGLWGERVSHPASPRREHTACAQTGAFPLSKNATSVPTSGVVIFIACAFFRSRGTRGDAPGSRRLTIYSP
jgi:hypothetical protein